MIDTAPVRARCGLIGPMVAESSEEVVRLQRIADLLRDAPLEDRALDAARHHIVHVVDAYLTPRLAGSDRHVVVAVTGPDGAGKSHLVNSLSGAHHTAEGVVRPTTTAPVVVVSPDPGDGWPDLERRLRAAAPVVAIRRDGGEVAERCVLVDLPPGDPSTMRLLDLADLVIVVATPGRYADRSTWALLRRLDAGGWPMWIVLNRAQGPTDEVVADFERRLAEQHIGAPVFPFSGADAADLRSLLLEVGGPGRAALLHHGMQRRTERLMQSLVRLRDSLEELDRHANELRAIADAEYAGAAEGARKLVDGDSLGPGAAEAPWGVLADRLAGVLTHRIGAAAGRTAASWAHTEAGRTLLADGGESLWRHSPDAATDIRDRLIGWEGVVMEVVTNHMRRRSSQAKVAEVSAAVTRAALGGTGRVPWRIRRRLRTSVDTVADEAAAELATLASDIVLDDRRRFLDRIGSTPATELVAHLRQIVGDAHTPAGPGRPVASGGPTDA